MTSRTLSSKDDMERALNEIGEALSDEVKAYLIGGCAMFTSMLCQTPVGAHMKDSI